MPTTTLTTRIGTVAFALLAVVARPAAAQESPMPTIATPAAVSGAAAPVTAARDGAARDCAARDCAARDCAARDRAARDRAAIAEVLTAVAHGADLRQWDQVRAAFADAVVLDYGTPERLAAEEIVARWRPLLEAFDATQHQVFDVAVSHAGDSAAATARFQATHTMDGGVWVLTGRYEYALRRGGGGWQVTAMRMVPGAASGDPTLLERARARAARATAAVADRGARRAANRGVVRAFFAALERRASGDELAALFAEDGRQVMPFAPEGFPRELVGRPAIARQYGGLPAAFTAMRFPDLEIRDLAEPDAFLATYRGDIALRGGGKYDNRYVGLFVIRDGRIAHFTEWFDPDVLQRAFGPRLRATYRVPR